VLACLLLLTVPAVAAGQNDRPPLLTQLEGTSGCVASAHSDAAEACTPAPGLEKPQAVVTSPSGSDVYAVSTKTNRILQFRANAAGALRYAGCVGATRGCHAARSLRAVSALAVSGNGRWVLALSADRALVTLLERDGRGTLSPRSCLSGRRAGRPRGCRFTGSLAGAVALALSRDGRAAFAAIPTHNALVGLQRKGDRLDVVRLAKGCVVDAGDRTSSALRGCQRARGLGSPGSVAVSPDGRTVYATNASPGSVSFFGRNARSAAIRFRGCLSNSGSAGCRPTTALAGATDIAVSADGSNVYVVAVEDRAVTAFARNSDGSLDQVGCYGAALRLAGRCTGVPTFVEPRQIALALAGDMAYVVDPSSSTVTSFDRAWGGDLAPEGPPQGCVSPFEGCEPAHGLLAADSVAVSSDSRTVYAASAYESAIAVFRAVPRP
jgi:DNA-binding beta-propeller fold protein YncE